MVNKKQQKRGISPTKRNLIWDIGIGLDFLVVFKQDLTGKTLHEWLAMALFAGVIAHIIFHWKWVVNITKRFFTAKLPPQTRLNYVINGGLAGAFVLMGVSGLMISESIMPIIGLGDAGGFWKDIHEIASNLALAAVGAHVLLHWKWLWVNGRKYLVDDFLKRLPALGGLKASPSRSDSLP